MSVIARIVALAGFLVCFPGLGSAQASPPVRLVLAVGSNQGLSSEAELSYAQRDAQHFIETLQNYAQVSPQDSYLITGETILSLSQAIDSLSQRAASYTDREVQLYFYFSGHADEKDLHIAGLRIPITDLESRLSSIAARLHILIIDGCRGLGDVALKGGFRRTIGFSAAPPSAPGMAGMIKMRSSSPGEASQEAGDLGAAIFTHYLLTALKGPGDYDHDQQITLDEAYRYAYRQTVKRSAMGPGNVMHPSVEMNVEGAGEIVVSRVTAHSAQLHFPPAVDTRYLVYRRPSGTLMGELWAHPQRRLSLTLSPGEYLVQQRKQNQGSAQIIQIEAAQNYRLQTNLFHNYPLSLLSQKKGALQINYHQAQLSYLGGLSHQATYGQSLRAVYRYLSGHQGVVLSVSGGESNYQKQQEVRERHLGLDLRYQRNHFLGPLHLNLGVGLRYVQQRFTRKDASRLVNLPIPIESFQEGLSLGPIVALLYYFPLSDRFNLTAEIIAQGYLRGEDGQAVFRPEAGLDLGFSYDF